MPHRTLLHNGQYLIGKVLGKPGGFGITYLAFDTKLETKVAIKEYLPRDLAGRDGDHATISAHAADDAEHFRYGLTQFLQEARTLARFDHANIVRVRNFFEENGTGYLVMDYYDGVTLADYLAQQPQGKLPEKVAVDILMPILDGLREVHAKNFLHRDIKPQNIYLTTGNRAILLDFGAARQAMSERSRSLSVVLSEGYAPYEQYHRRGEQGPWTDIYACAAVLYHAVAGEPPPPATERMSKDELDIGALGVSTSLANALRLGLAVDHKNRPQTMKEFQGLSIGCVDACAVEAGAQRHIPTSEKVAETKPIAPANGDHPSFLRVMSRLIFATFAVVILIVILFAYSNGEKNTVLAIPASMPTVSQTAMQAEERARQAQNVEQTAWREAERVNTEAAYRHYQSQYPQGLHSSQAVSKLPVYLPMDNMVVNLADAGGERVAQVGITLKVVDAHAADSVKAYMPTIRSGVLSLLSQRTAEELLSYEGKQKLIQDILRETVLPFGDGEDESSISLSGKSPTKRKSTVKYPVIGILFSSLIVQ
jgi:serine/threonine protein kinase